jgi:hypothetical protein
MARNEIRQLYRLQAVTREGSEEVPGEALTAFAEAGRLMDRPGAFDSCAIAVDGEAFRSLTGFSPNGGEFISPDAVRRSAEAASPGRTKALGNAHASMRNDYIALGVFLRVCAAQALGLKADLPTGRERR